MPALNFDLDSFSFHVPLKASSAKQIAAAARHTNSAANIALNLMSLPPRRNKLGGPVAADSISAPRRSQQKGLSKKPGDPETPRTAGKRVVTTTARRS